MTAPRFSASKHFAQAMFNAEYGHTGLSWGDVNDEFRSEWERKACAVLESFYSRETPVMVIDLREDSLELLEA